MLARVRGKMAAHLPPTIVEPSYEAIPIQGVGSGRPPSATSQGVGRGRPPSAVKKPECSIKPAIRSTTQSKKTIFIERINPPPKDLEPGNDLATIGPRV